MDGGCGSGNRVNGDIGGTGTAGYVADLNIVNVHIAGGVGSGQGDILAVAAIGAERRLEHLPTVDISGTDSGDEGEGGEVVGVGHDTHLDGIRGRGLVSGKADLQGVNGSSDGRKRQIGIVATAAVEIDRVVATIAARGIEVWIVGVRIVRAAMPAFNYAGTRSGWGGEVLEIFGEGEH